MENKYMNTFDLRNYLLHKSDKNEHHISLIFFHFYELIAVNYGPDHQPIAVKKGSDDHKPIEVNKECDHERSDHKLRAVNKGIVDHELIAVNKEPDHKRS